MKVHTFLCAFLVVLIPVRIFSLGLDPNTHKLNTPPRIIRTCCAFGSDIGVIGVPFLRLTETTSIEEIGEHKFMGGKKEGNGILYTRKGGFIDIGHLRDQADWTAYLYHVITTNKGHDLDIKLPHEGGKKKLFLEIPDTISNEESILLAGRITYDLSVWHEIATWFKVSSVPFVPERYSAFSIEDDYSNLLGVNLGMEALRSSSPFEEAMTILLRKKLELMDVVTSEQETLDAMEMVRNDWWTREKKFPSRKVLIVRDTTIYTNASPMLVPALSNNVQSCVLELPQNENGAKPLSNYYKLALRLNRKFPYRQMFPDKKGRKITQEDFLTIMKRANLEINQKTALDQKRASRKESKLQ